jgi:glycosyltransferase involved in cell wall biosynthesis
VRKSWFVSRLLRFGILPVPIFQWGLAAIVIFSSYVIVVESVTLALVYFSAISTCLLFGALSSFTSRPAKGQTNPHLTEPHIPIGSGQSSLGVGGAEFSEPGTRRPVSRKEAWGALEHFLDNPPASRRRIVREKFADSDEILFVVLHSGSEDALNQSLKSLLAQSSPSWQAVIVAPPKDDSTQLQSHMKTTPDDDRIRVVSVTSLDPHALNLVLGQSAPRYISFLESGDAVLPDFVAEALMRLGTSNAEALVFTFFEMTDFAGQLREAMGIPGSSREKSEQLLAGPAKVAQLSPLHCATLHGKVFSTDLIRASSFGLSDDRFHLPHITCTLPWLEEAKQVWLSSKSLSVNKGFSVSGWPTGSPSMAVSLKELEARLRVLVPNRSDVGEVVARLAHLLSGNRPETSKTSDLGDFKSDEQPARLTPDEAVDCALPQENKITLTIIIPIRGRIDLFRQLVSSLQPQATKETEVIVVVDSIQSADVEEVKNVLRDFRNAKVMTGASPGAGPGRNLGAQNASGEYLWFVDADDIVPPGAVGTVLNRISATTSDILLFNAEHFHHPHREPETASWFLRASGLEEGQPLSPRSLSHRLFQLTSPSPWNLIFNREFFEREHLRFSSLPSSNDLSCVMTALAIAEEISIYFDVIYLYRRNAPGGLQVSGRNYSLPRAFRDLKNELKSRDVGRWIIPTYSDFVRRTLLDWWAKPHPTRFLYLALAYPDLLAFAAKNRDPDGRISPEKVARS